MSPREVYISREAEFRAAAERLQKLADRLSLARLLSFVGGLLLFVLLSTLSVAAAVTALTVSLLLFGWFVISYGSTEKKKTYFKHLADINSRELKCLDGAFSGFHEGSEYSERDHPYSHDLDIFGKSSLFQYICRTTSKPAADLLAEYLKSAAPVEEILLRQEAASDLQAMTDWRQDLQTLGHSNAGAGNDPQPLLNWLAGANLFLNRRSLKVISGFLSLIGITAITLAISGFPAAILAPVFSVNFIFYFLYGKKIATLHRNVSKSADLLIAYSSSIRLIEDNRFTAAKLLKLQASFSEANSASAIIRKLSKLVNRLDSRLNVLVSIPLNLLFFTDIHFCLALEKWKNENSKKIPKWFAAMAEFEVLSSIGTMAFNNPDWVMPDIAAEFFILRAERMGHPLIPSDRRINNDFETSGGGRTILVTGSNMSGKSTFLRTCGINTVLALAGAPVCASSFTVSNVKIHSSMRISDSLEENISSFYAELKRLNSIIKEAETNPEVFLLLDEILRGTNSNDRFTGSVALIKQLTGYGTVAMVATHDLKLAELSAEMQGKIDNYHFDVKISGDELFFDYKLTHGICKSMNASILMKKMGIKV
jgi:hypothetical protein